MSRTSYLRVRLTDAELGQVRQIAAFEGVTVSELVRRWVTTAASRPLVRTTGWHFSYSSADGGAA